MTLQQQKTIAIPTAIKRSIEDEGVIVYIMSDYNLCLTVIMGSDGKPTPMPIPRDKCHCKGEQHFQARGTIDIEGQKIKVNNDDYLKFLSTLVHQQA